MRGVLGVSAGRLRGLDGLDLRGDHLDVRRRRRLRLLRGGGLLGLLLRGTPLLGLLVGKLGEAALQIMEQSGSRAEDVVLQQRSLLLLGGQLSAGALLLVPVGARQLGVAGAHGGR